MKRKKDYHTKNHPSLWNHKDKIEKEKKSFKETIVFLLILILIISIIYGLFFSKLFQIKKIIITGTDQIGEIEQIQTITQDFLEHKKFFVLPNKNLFIFSRGALRDLLLKRFDLSKAEVETDWPQTLRIEIKHKFPALVWQEGENYFTVYNDGVIKNRIENIAEYGLPIINRGTTTEVVLGEQIVSKPQMEYIQKLYSLFSFYFKNINLKQFIVSSLESREVRLIVEEILNQTDDKPGVKVSWQVVFSLDLDPQESLETVKSVLDQKIGDRVNLQYIDVRVKDKVYYK